MFLSQISVANPETKRDFQELEQINYLDTSSITKNYIDSFQLLVAGRDKIPSRAKRKVVHEDIVYSTVRPINQHYGFIQNPQDNLLVSTGFTVLRVDPNKANPRFVYEYITQDKFTYLLHDIGEDSTSTYPGIKPYDLLSLEIELPSRKEQDFISYLANKIDTKIELNLKMNNVLHNIAMAVFKSWFIEYGPMRSSQSETASLLFSEVKELFPDSFQDTILGDVPKGWEITNLKNNLDYVIGGDWGSEEMSEHNKMLVRCIRGADMPNIKLFSNSIPPERYLKESSYKKRVLQENDLVIEISGGSPTQSTGRTVLIKKEFLEMQNHSVVCSNFCKLLRTEKYLSTYVYYFIQHLYESDQLFQFEKESTGIKNFDFEYFANEKNFVLPDKKLLIKFSDVINKIDSKRNLNLKEIINLRKLRKEIIPNLISGNLKIPNVEKLLQEAGI